MISIDSLNQTEYKLLKDHCISQKEVSTIYRAAHRKQPLVYPHIKIKIIDFSKFPIAEKQKYPRLIKKLLLNNVRMHYQNVHNRGDLPQDIFKLYCPTHKQGQIKKEVFYVLNQFHRGEQLRKCILKNNECLQNPQIVRRLAKQLLWNMIQGGGIQMFLYTSTNTIIDDIRLLTHTNEISTTGFLFVQSILDSIRKLQYAKNIKNNTPIQIQQKEQLVKNLENQISLSMKPYQKEYKQKSQQKAKIDQEIKELKQKLAQSQKTIQMQQKEQLVKNLENQMLSIKQQQSLYKQKCQKKTKIDQEIRKLKQKLAQSQKTIQQQEKYIKQKKINKQQFLQVYPFLHKDILELPKSQKEEFELQKSLKQKIRNFASLYLMMITRKDLNLKEMDHISNKINDLKQFPLSLVKEKLSLIDKCYLQFLSRDKIKQRIMEYQQKINLKKDSLLEFFKNILIQDNFKFLQVSEQNNDHMKQKKKKQDKKKFKKCWRYVYQISGFLNKNTNIQQLDNLFKKLNQILFAFQPKKYFYQDLGIDDPLFYLPVKFNLNFISLTAQNRPWYNCFQDNTFSTQSMKAINRIKKLVANQKQQILKRIPKKIQIAMTNIKTKDFFTELMKIQMSKSKLQQLQKRFDSMNITRNQQQKIELQQIKLYCIKQLSKTLPILEYFNKYESRFFLEKKEYDVVIDDKVEHVTNYIPSQTYINNFSYLYF